MSSSQTPKSDGRRTSSRLASLPQPMGKGPLFRIVNVSDHVTRLAQGDTPFIIIKTSDYVAECSANYATRALKDELGSFIHDGYYAVVLDEDGYFPRSGTMEVLVLDGVECKACLNFLLKMRVGQEDLCLHLEGNRRGIPVFPEHQQQRKKPLSAALVTDCRLEDVQIGRERFFPSGQEVSDPPIYDFSGKLDSEAVCVRQYCFEKWRITTRMYKGWRGNLRWDAIKTVADDYEARGEEKPTKLLFLVGLDDILAFPNADEAVVEDIIRNFLHFFEECHDILPEASFEWIGIGYLGPDHPRKWLLDAVVKGLDDAFSAGLMPAYLRFENLCDVGMDCGLNVEDGEVKWNDEFVIEVGKDVVDKIRACGEHHVDLKEPFGEEGAAPEDLPVEDEEGAVDADEDSSTGNNDGTGAAEGESGSDGSVTPRNGSLPSTGRGEGIDGDDDMSDGEEWCHDGAVCTGKKRGNERWFVRLPVTDKNGDPLKNWLRGGYCTRKGCAGAFFRTWPLLLEHLDTKHGAAPCYVCWVFLEGSYRSPRHETSANHAKSALQIQSVMDLFAGPNAPKMSVQEVALFTSKKIADGFFPPGWKPPRQSTAQPVDADTEAGARDAAAEVGPEVKNGGERPPGGDQLCQDKEKAKEAETGSRKEIEAVDVEAEKMRVGEIKVQHAEGTAAVLPRSQGSVNKERAAGVPVVTVFQADDRDSEDEADIVVVQQNVDKIVEQLLDDDEDVAMMEAGEPEHVLMDVDRPGAEVDGLAIGGGDHQPAKDGNETDTAGPSADVDKGPSDGMDESKDLVSDVDSVTSECPLLIDEGEDDDVKVVCMAPQRPAAQGTRATRVRKAVEQPLAEPPKPKMRKMKDRVRAPSAPVNAEQDPAKGSEEFPQHASPGSQAGDGVVERRDMNVEEGVNANVEQVQGPPPPEEPKKPTFYKVFEYHGKTTGRKDRIAIARSLCMRNGLCKVGACRKRFQLTWSLFEHLSEDHSVSCCFVCLKAFNTPEDLAAHRGLKRHAANREKLLRNGSELSLTEEIRKANHRWKEVEAEAGVTGH